MLPRRPPIFRHSRDRNVLVGSMWFEADPKDPKIFSSLVLKAADVIDEIASADTNRARQIEIAIPWLESYLGGAGSFVYEGEPTWNIGAVRAISGQDSFPHGDRKADGTPYTAQYAKFPSMKAGYQNWFKRWPTSARLAAQMGDAHGVASAMYKAHYFVGKHDPKSDPSAASKNIAEYAVAIVGSAKNVAKVLGEPLLVTNTASSESSELDSSLSSGSKVLISLGLLGVTVGTIGYAAHSISGAHHGRIA